MQNKLLEKIDKYLEGSINLDEKVSRKEALQKVERTIKSAKTDKQLEVASKMVGNFIKMYGEKFIDDVKNLLSPLRKNTTDKFLRMIDDQKKKIELEKERS
jgi:intergrase/recombinase